jgi:hypothetical protein
VCTSQCQGAKSGIVASSISSIVILPGAYTQAQHTIFSLADPRLSRSKILQSFKTTRFLGIQVLIWYLRSAPICSQASDKLVPLEWYCTGVEKYIPFVSVVVHNTHSRLNIEVN